MSSKFLFWSQALLVFLLVCTDFTYSQVHYYVRPSPNGPCPRNSFCLTLPQLAISIGNEINISLIFLPGNHTLDRELSLNHRDSCSLVAAQLNETVYIECVNQSGRFVINDSTSILIKDLHFIGCGGNKVSHVGWFVLENSIFQGVEGSGTALLLNKVATACIIESLFVFNTYYFGKIFESQSILELLSDDTILDIYLSLKQSTSLTAGRALYITLSNVSIVSSTFMHNGAEIGGVIIAENSLLNISNSTFGHNEASVGGVLVSSECSIRVVSSTFCGNSAEIFGGVLISHNDLFTINITTFTDNNSSFDGGVLATFTERSYAVANEASFGESVSSTTYNESSFIIADSSFADNSAYRFGGVIKSSDASSFIVINSTFTNNSAKSGGVIMTPTSSTFNISHSKFMNNSAISRGGVIQASIYSESSFYLKNSIFTYNVAYFSGGVMSTSGASLITITSNTFRSNTAAQGGVVQGSGKSLFTINDNMFVRNAAKLGGVMMTSGNSSFNITDNIFAHNFAYSGGVMEISTTLLFTVASCTFMGNGAQDGGVIQITYTSHLTIDDCVFAKNVAVSGGVILNRYDSTFTITRSTFTNNSATDHGGVINYNSITYGNLKKSYINNSTFISNSASHGGVISLSGECSINVSSNTFIDNRATSVGGVIWCSQVKLEPFAIDSSRFEFNTADDYGGVMFTIDCSTRIVNSTFDHNLGSLYLFSSNVTFVGHNAMENFIDPLDAGNSTLTEGGAITMFQSTAIFTGKCALLDNLGTRRGAMLASRSKIIVYGEVTVANNAVASSGDGGAISLQQSHFEISGRCNIFNNSALRGGGIHATGSTVVVYQPGTLVFANNTAENGGGLYLEINTKLYILRTGSMQENSLQFIGNRAKSGGAVYVADDINSGACSANVECFIQSLALYQGYYVSNVVSMLFSGNIATEYGDNLFGGLLDRCVPSPFAEVYNKQKQKVHYSGVAYLGNTSNIALSSVASLPVRVCFCSDVGQVGCSYQHPTIRVKKGETFTVSLVAVDQVNHTVEAEIVSSLSSSAGGFGEGQQTQMVKRRCTDVLFNVFSPFMSETINIYADGPCGSALLSTNHLTIHFMDCTCPVGFEPRSNNHSATKCECMCDSELSPYITRCDPRTSLLFRENTRSWIAYANETISPGFVIHPSCPFDYCYPPGINVTIDFNLATGEDAQCANGRRGVLCGACDDDLSLSLGSSRCLPCPSHWPAVFVVILVAAIIAGITLVTALMALNITVAVGLINGFIFYADIVSASGYVFFPSSEPSFPTVFVAWLNLDFGIDVCFFDGLDAYAKAWLHLAFTIYIVSLVVVVIIVSEYSPRFVRLIGKKDPIATLATLILLSYAKLLSVTIDILSFAVLHFPNGSQETVWLLDGNVKYFQGKHIPLTFAAVLIILIGLPYSILLLFWQWIVRLPGWKVFRWTRNTKLNTFISTYHVPYSSKHRYWTGLLLLVRVVLYVVASITVASKPQISVLVTIITVGCLLLLKAVFGSRVYRKSLVDIIDTVLYFNLLALAAFSLYDFKLSVTKQTAVAYISVTITFILLIGVIVYHVNLIITCRWRRTPKVGNLNEYLLTRFRPDKAEVTHSVVEFPILQPITIDAETMSYQ